jgi:adenosylmethionine-8-amino-7-oxononanoate aminotransferase
MSACLISERVADVLYSERDADGAFSHGFTASGHPVAAAVALANIAIIESEKLPQNAAAVGGYLRARLGERLSGQRLVSSIRGAGLLIGVELDRNKTERQPFTDPARVGAILVKACFDQNLIVRGAHGRVIAAMAPPLILTKREADDIVERLERAIDRFTTTVTAEGLA